MTDKYCKHCGAFIPVLTVKIYCSSDCRKKAAAVRSKKVRADYKLELLRIEKEQKLRASLSKGAVGAASELVVCADLINHAWYAYRSVSPVAPCDVIALKDGKTYRVEVRTGHYMSNDRISVNVDATDTGRFDILAVVIGYEVYYIPDHITGEPTDPLLLKAVSKYL